MSCATAWQWSTSMRAGSGSSFISSSGSSGGIVERSNRSQGIHVTYLPCCTWTSSQAGSGTLSTSGALRASRSARNRRASSGLVLRVLRKRPGACTSDDSARELHGYRRTRHSSFSRLPPLSRAPSARAAVTKAARSTCVSGTRAVVAVARGRLCRVILRLVNLSSPRATSRF